MASFEDPDLDTADALVHLASDHGEAVLGAEQALTGELEELNGRPVSASFDGVFEVASDGPASAVRGCLPPAKTNSITSRNQVRSRRTRRCGWGLVPECVPTKRPKTV